jgi:predicted outer membrane repeat protein
VNQAVNLHPGNTGQITFASGVNTVTLSRTIIISESPPVIIEGSAAHVVTITEGGSIGDLFQISTGSQSNGVTFDYLRMTNASHGNGAFYASSPVTVENSRIDHNTSLGYGGGFATSSDLTLVDCTVDDNESFDFGGGGFEAVGTNSVIKVTGCTFFANEASDNGGAIEALTNGESLTVVDSTFDGNSAVGGTGGAIYIRTSVTATITNSTIVRNSASQSGGGVACSGTLNLKNDVIALNTAVPGADVFLTGTLASASHNFIGDATNSGVSAVNGNQVGTTAHPLNPKVGTLANNGGPTETDAPLAGSPTIDTGDDTVISTVTTDQRGLPRKSGSHVDIGAVEVQQPVAAAVAPVKATPPAPVVHHGRRFGP